MVLPQNMQELLLSVLFMAVYPKDSDAGRDWGQEEKGTTEDEMAGWHHWLDGWVWVSLGELRELVMDREAWRAAIHGVEKSWTRLSDWLDLIWSDPEPRTVPESS